MPDITTSGIAPPATALTIGTTAITGGVDTRVLFDDAGFVGEIPNLTYVKGTRVLTVGASTATTLLIQSGVRLPPFTVTNGISPYTSLQSELYYRANCTAGAVTILLPAASTNSGRAYIVKKIDATANAVILTPAGADTIEAPAATWAVQFQSFTIVSDGVSNWEIV